ncbi:MAG: HEAT repeat domain-containing protein [Gemmatimonadota bacterium]|nr:HEAT repeat domain-containing protein [Gemmatimonadota bacterium]
MRILNATLFFAATTLAAQEPPRPAQAPRAPRPAEPAAMPALPALPVDAPTPLPAPAPVVAVEPLDGLRIVAPRIGQTLGPLDAIYLDGQGQGRVIAPRPLTEEARELARLQAELAREQSRMESETAREMACLESQMAREQARINTDEIREMARVQSQMALEQARIATTVGGSFYYTPSGSMLPSTMPRAWAQGDPADSLYRAAMDVMNKGDYRKAATLLKEIPVKFQYSQYAAEAMYWQAHALYRVGGTPDLQEALQTLETLKSKYPNSRLRNSQADVGALQVRIAGVLNTRGRGGDDIVKRALAENSNICDREEAQIRSAALNALMQTDPAAATDYAQKMLAKKDDCSRELRRNAVFLIGNRPGPSSVATLISVAKTDPSVDVRTSAINYLGRMQSDDALAAIEELLKSSDDQQIQREAVRALANNANPRARAGIKALVERNDVSEALRTTALDALNPERATQEDVAWLQGLYTKMESPRLRSRIISAMARIGGTQNEKWFTTLANNENESIEVRLEALRRAGTTMDIAALGRLYDQTGQRQLRMELVRQLGSRKETESIDKLGEIVKSGTDPEVRSRAMTALINKKDERATKLVMSLLDRP